MSRHDPGMDKLLALPPEERRAFCRQVLEGLSDLVQGEAPEELCRRVEELLADCPPFLAFRNTFEATLRLLAEASDTRSAAVDEERYRACVEQVRRRLREPDRGVT